MTDQPQIRSGRRNDIAIDQIAQRQWGVFRGDQVDVNRAVLHRAVRAGRLHRLAPGIFSTIAPALLSEKGRLTAALFAAGEGSALSHQSAGWWLKLSDWMPPILILSTPGRNRGLADTKLYRERTFESFEYNDIAVTTVPQTLLDMAIAADFNKLRRALAEAEFHHNVQARDLIPIASNRSPGSTQLKRAIERHLPKLAKCRNELEREFLLLCERYDIPLPEPNYRIGLKTVDMVWPDRRVAIELHGHQGHDGDRRGTRDSTRQIHARRDGYRTTEYWFEQVMNEPDLVADDVRRMLSAPQAGRPGPAGRPLLVATG